LNCASSYRKVGLAIAKQLLGPDATLSGDNCVLKPCRIGGPTPWHQDEAHNDPKAYEEQVTIWIALFDTTPANGAMVFIPRSHLRGVLPHRAYGGADGANSIECCGDFDPQDAKVCPVRKRGWSSELFLGTARWVNRSVTAEEPGCVAAASSSIYGAIPVPTGTICGTSSNKF
jgi:hypothetical protein